MSPTVPTPRDVQPRLTSRALPTPQPRRRRVERALDALGRGIAIDDAVRVATTSAPVLARVEAIAPDGRKVVVRRPEGTKAVVRPDQLVALRPVLHQPIPRRSK